MVAQYHQSDVTIESLCKAQFHICLIALRKEKRGEGVSNWKGVREGAKLRV